MSVYENNNWGLNEEMEELLNSIELNSEKRVILTDGNKQFIYDNGQIYVANARNSFTYEKLSKSDFKEQAEEIMINYRCNKKNDIIIE